MKNNIDIKRPTTKSSRVSGGTGYSADLKPARALKAKTALTGLSLALAANLGTADVFVPSDGATGDRFGNHTSLSGSTMLVGAFGNSAHAGAAYVYDLDNSANNYGEIKLTASDGATYDLFGEAVSLSGSTVLVGARNNNTSTGAVYGYDLGNSANNYGEFKLTASDGARGDNFGFIVSQSGSTAMVGAAGKNTVYVYDISKSAADGNYGEFKLTASDGAIGDNYGNAISQSGSTALIAAYGSHYNTGAVYVYDLDNSANNYGEFKLTASDGAMGDSFGSDISQSGSTVMIGADGSNLNAGAAYLYDLSKSAADGNYGEIKLTASDSFVDDSLGVNVSQSGTAFAIGATYAYNADDVRSGKVYTGDIRAFATLDSGNTALATGGLSAASQRDWIIGETTSGNDVTISSNVAGTGQHDVVSVLGTGKAVYIGKEAGANNNTLFVEGKLIANHVYVGAAGNSGNGIMFATGSVMPTNATVHLAEGNFVGLEGYEGTELDFVDLVQSFAVANSQLLVSGVQVNVDNADTLLTKWYDAASGYTYFGNSMVPEPATYAALLTVGILGFTLLLRRRRTARS